MSTDNSTVIRQLSDKTVNLIAAGEVVERPYSVVKELVENSIDANAKNISIELEEAGKNLIRVTDDGVGMSYKDLELSVERHTTSKLQENDIVNISTFGFRGEALPSISAISKVKITTKKKTNSDSSTYISMGWQLSISNNTNKLITKVAHVKGTSIEIRDLFFATPARLKFLKSDKYELNASIAWIRKIAIAHPNINFLLTHNNKQILDIKNKNIEERIFAILGEDFYKNSIPVNLSNNSIKISGFISLPTFNKSTADMQYIYVNKRPVKDRILSYAIKIAYMDVLSNNRYPVIVLFIDIEHDDIDVNVHPAKTEIRFRDSNFVRGCVVNAIQQSIFEHGNKSVSCELSKYASPNVTAFEKTQEKNLELNFSSSINTSTPTLNEKTSNVFHSKDTYGQYTPPLIVQNSQQSECDQKISNAQNYSINTQYIDKTQNNNNTTDNNLLKNGYLGCARAQLHNNYIISQTTDAIIIVDQHAAHERITYEKMKQAYTTKSIIKNQLLLPEIVSINDNTQADLLEDQIPKLSKMGLEIERVSNTHFAISSIPNISTAHIDIKSLINDIACELQSIGQDISLDKLIEHILETIACHYSVRSGRNLTINEMNELLKQMESTNLSGQCNHGRPTYVKLALKDIERMFKR